MQALDPTDADSHSDAKLIAAIAGSRDLDAFTRLTQRYERLAYNLACHLTHHQALAEEAVQEALLRIWLSAASFQPAGSARGWILQIVAREALKKIRDRRKDQKKMERAQANYAAIEPPEPSQVSADQEILGCLRQALAGLPPLDQQLLALYYGAGMSQQEISQALSLSPRSVSHKIQERLKGLRSTLSQAGFGAAAPLLTWEGISEAICSGYEVPPGLREKIMGKIAVSARESLRSAAASSPYKAQAMLGSAAGLRLAGLGLVVAAAAVAGALLTQRPAAQPVAKPAQDQGRPPADEPGEVKAADPEVLYDDGFDGATLDPFWVKVNPPAQALVGAGNDKSSLVLKAFGTPLGSQTDTRATESVEKLLASLRSHDASERELASGQLIARGQSVRAAVGQALANAGEDVDYTGRLRRVLSEMDRRPEVEIVSRVIPLKGKFLLVTLDPLALEAEDGFDYGAEILDGSGKSVFAFGERSGEKKGSAPAPRETYWRVREHVFPSNPSYPGPIKKILLEPPHWLGFWQTNHSDKIKVPLPESVALRFFVRANSPGKSTEWAIRRMTVKWSKERVNLK